MSLNLNVAVYEGLFDTEIVVWIVKHDFVNLENFVKVLVFCYFFCCYKQSVE